LKVPHDPPRDQEELLAATLQVIVSFIVLCSIIIHGLSIPFFSASRQIHSRTVTLTRTWTSGQGRLDTGQADWVTWVRRPAGSAAASQVMIRQDEETGEISEIQTRMDDVSEVDKDGEVPTVVARDTQIAQVTHVHEEVSVLPDAGQGLRSRGRQSEVGQPTKVVRFPSAGSSAE